MLRAVIFDFDGVICDSEMLHFEAFNQTLQDYGLQVTREQYYIDYLGLTDLDFYYKLFEQGLLKADSEDAGKLAQRKKRIYKQIAETQANVIDGVSDFLQLLGENNIAMAICSGALLAEIEFVLEKAYLKSCFQTIVSAEQVENGKPAPDGFLLTLERLNESNKPQIEPNQCVVVEDSCWGLEAARAANMKTVAVTNSYSADELESADKIVGHLSELTIEALNKICP